MFSWRFALVLGTFLFPISAIAQQMDPPVIVITPTKTLQAIDEIPYAVSSVGDEALQQAQPQSVDDALKEVPNVASAGGPRTENEEPNIRGLSDHRIVIKIDGIRRNFRAQYGGRYFLDPWLIGNAEVLRGANSTIDGSGAIGGVVQLFTPDAKNELRGSENFMGGQVRLGYQSVNDEAAGMAMGYGAYQNADVLSAYSFRESGGIKTGGGDDYLSPSQALPRNFLTKVGYDFNAGSRSEFRVSSYENKSGMPVDPTQPLSAFNGASTRKTEVKGISFRQTLHPEEGPLKDALDVSAIVYHSEYTLDTLRTSDLRRDLTLFHTTGMDTNNTSRFALGDVKNALTYGVEFFADEQSGTRNGSIRTLLGNGKDQNLGLYIQDEASLLDNKLTLTPGLRFDAYEVTPGTAGLEKNDETQLSPKFGANYKIDEVWSAYGSVAVAFRTPTLTELYESGTMYPGNSLLPNPDLKPETALEKEVGVRYITKDAIVPSDKVRLSLAFFHNAIDDYIEAVSMPTTTQSVNVAKATLIGSELEGKYTLNDTTLNASFGLVRGQNETDDEPLADVPAGRIVTGLEHFFRQQSLTLGGRMTYYVAQTRIPLEEVGYYTSDDAFLFDLYGSWVPFDGALHGMALRFGVDNLFDVGYRRYLSYLPEAGRNFKVDMTWKF